ncbi:ATP-binding cassette domain-containing protein [Longirhabdus pacifica]|uniref:ATP-binding cassette domain-containing protein n=1 Tax=Longirhabdus pacifica TaxID=2305227 RepID=UPI0010089C4E|nr:ATP-binding cassette domain-containing protein [Longirhabdus pacifica]
MYNVENLKFKYKKTDEYILDNVSFSLKKDKLNVIVGLNGSGKTTLFDCLTSVLKPESGQIQFPRYHDILYLTQTLFFSYELKGKDFANFIMRLDNKAKIKDPSSLASEEHPDEIQLLSKLWNRKIGKMSLGERRWLFVFFLTKIDKPLYILDEPTSAVDPISRLKIIEKMKQLIASGKVCVCSTHQLQDLLFEDCHIIFLHQGKIKYEGSFYDWLEINETQNPDIAFERMTKEIAL